ncbi:MAG: ATPase domain-containing protein [Massilia sp.]|uniref:ATPase domain-containing protein n=1 Tax=Massilia sp. TaxID=1882437 RepID=UPI0019C6D493|nr:AAA family ATPase [Oxalobacteraceae sp. CFBP 8761]MBD8626895.1 AAA family ATPase [Oxalobacteraceae sp. CFBP 8753]MBD8631391.1 AAA family ATPase [Oxalobacteraceae sp. CFBP 8755]MBD8723553.1 AAA family ATPase [Oxalobacteraceae sp. CFBP 13708]
MSDKVSLGKLSTGVQGLDVLLGGGLSEFSFNLIAGPPGSGKTTLAHQIMFSLATTERRALFFTVLGEPPLKMLRYQQQYSFFDMQKVGTVVRYVNLAEDLRAGDFSTVLARMMKEVEDFAPSLVFVDSFRSVAQTARSGNEGVADLQHFIQDLGTRMTSWQATTFLIGEYANSDAEASPIMTVADGMISLTPVHDDNSVVRKMRVVKMRGQAHMNGSHTFRITSDGIRVYPRMLPPLAHDHHDGAPTDRDHKRIPTGTRDLDVLLHGGLPQGHSLLVTGPSGCGKTILATRFLQEGVRQGEKGVALSFEKGTSRLRNAELAAMVDAGDVVVLESRMIDLTVDEVLEALNEAIDRTGARRVVVDSLSELSLYLAPEGRNQLRSTVFQMLTSLVKRNVTVLVTMGMDDDFTHLRFSQSEIAYLTDAVVLMRFGESAGQLRRFISVVKVRGSSHSHDLREFHIDDAGIHIDAISTAHEGVLHGLPTTRGAT